MPWARNWNGPSLLRLGLEDADERLADRLPLLLGIGDTLQPLVELLGRVGIDEVHAEGAGEDVLDQIRLAEPEQPVVDEDRGQLLADRPVDQRGRDRRIDSAAQPQQHPAGPDLQPDLLDRVLDERGGRPGWLDPADLGQEVAQDDLAHRRVGDFGVELDRDDPVPGDCRAGRVVALADRGEAVRHLRDVVAVAHPDIERIGQVGEEGRLGRGDPEPGRTILSPIGRLDRSAQCLRDQLHAIADAEHRQPALQHPVRQLRRAGLVDTGRATREDDSAHVARLDLGPRRVVVEELAVNPGLAYAPRDQLAVLRAEIEHGHHLGGDRLNGGGGRRIEGLGHGRAFLR